MKMKTNTFAIQCGTYLRKYIVNKFGIIKGSKLLYGPSDYICEGETVIKYVCSTIRLTRNMISRRWQWSVLYNRRPTIFLLGGWNYDQSKLLHLWKFEAKEMVNGREFWDRESFSISEVPKSIYKYHKYEMDIIPE